MPSGGFETLPAAGAADDDAWPAGSEDGAEEAEAFLSVMKRSRLDGPILTDHAKPERAGGSEHVTPVYASAVHLKRCPLHQ